MAWPPTPSATARRASGRRSRYSRSSGNGCRCGSRPCRAESRRRAATRSSGAAPRAAPSRPAAARSHRLAPPAVLPARRRGRACRRSSRPEASRAGWQARRPCRSAPSARRRPPRIRVRYSRARGQAGPRRSETDGHPRHAANRPSPVEAVRRYRNRHAAACPHLPRAGRATARRRGATQRSSASACCDR